MSFNEIRFGQPFQLLLLFRRSKNMIIIFLSIVCTRANAMGFRGRQNLNFHTFNSSGFLKTSELAISYKRFYQL